VARASISRKLAGISWCRLSLVLPFRSRGIKRQRYYPFPLHLETFAHRLPHQPAKAALLERIMIGWTVAGTGEMVGGF
jgi:hypothetical protein